MKACCSNLNKIKLAVVIACVALILAGVLVTVIAGANFDIAYEDHYYVLIKADKEVDVASAEEAIAGYTSLYTLYKTYNIEGNNDGFSADIRLNDADKSVDELVKDLCDKYGVDPKTAVVSSVEGTSYFADCLVPVIALVVMVVVAGIYAAIKHNVRTGVLVAAGSLLSALASVGLSLIIQTRLTASFYVVPHVAAIISMVIAFIALDKIDEVSVSMQNKEDRQVVLAKGIKEAMPACAFLCVVAIAAFLVIGILGGHFSSIFLPLALSAVIAFVTSLYGMIPYYVISK
ncbi:MAG: hypothetical protein E7315_01845 [Clostridiales bacterium]|nr:hypothetical protein [Clostridiales bacterium]